MKNSSRQYERNACFYLWIYKEDQKPQLTPMPINEKLFLPLSKKYYKTTLKNLKVYINELIESDLDIVYIEIERATHIGLIERINK